MKITKLLSDLERAQLNFANKQPPKKKRKSRTAFTNHQVVFIIIITIVFTIFTSSGRHQDHHHHYHHNNHDGHDDHYDHLHHHHSRFSPSITFTFNKRNDSCTRNIILIIIFSNYNNINIIISNFSFLRSLNWRNGSSTKSISAQQTETRSLPI